MSSGKGFFYPASVFLGVEMFLVFWHNAQGKKAFFTLLGGIATGIGLSFSRLFSSLCKDRNEFSSPEGNGVWSPQLQKMGLQLCGLGEAIWKVFKNRDRIWQKLNHEEVESIRMSLVLIYVCIGINWLGNIAIRLYWYNYLTMRRIQPRCILSSA